MSDGATPQLKVALVGPTHPYKGGVAAHTTALAHELDRGRARGHARVVEPPLPVGALPGRAGGARRLAPTSTPFPRTLRVLSWARPDTWVRTGRRLRDVDVIVVVHVIPAVVPAHLALLRAAGVGRTTPDRSRPAHRASSRTTCCRTRATPATGS